VKELIQPLLLAVAILLIGVGVYRFVFGLEEEPAVLVESVRGTVERHGRDGTQVVEVGMRVGLEERIVVGTGSETALTFGENMRLTLQSDSSLRVLGASVNGLRVELEDGRVQATVRPGGASLGVVAGGREVTSENARFTMGVGLSDALGVEVREGRVAVSGVEGVESVGPGERLLATADGPLVQGAIPTQLLLEVQWPGAEATRMEKALIRGSTEPGAEVMAGGEAGEVRTVADAEGRFALEVALAEGANSLKLQARGVTGREQTAESTLIRDSEAPTGRFEVNY
jgi:hypothetical protein